LIDLLGGRHRMPRKHRQRDEALVFRHHPPGENMRSALLTGETCGERQQGTGSIKLESHDPPQQAFISGIAQTGSEWQPCRRLRKQYEGKIPIWIAPLRV